jgi:hypothetical protein
MQLIDSPAGARTSVLPLNIAFSNYDRTRPLIDGRVVPEGIAPRYTLEDIAQFCERPVYEEFDVAEMSLSWYVAARCRSFRCACPSTPTCSAAPTRRSRARAICAESASARWATASR